MLVLMQIAVVLLRHAWHPASICVSTLQSQQLLPHLELFAGVVLKFASLFSRLDVSAMQQSLCRASAPHRCTLPSQ